MSPFYYWQQIITKKWKRNFEYSSKLYRQHNICFNLQAFTLRGTLVGSSFYFSELCWKYFKRWVLLFQYFHIKKYHEIERSFNNIYNWLILCHILITIYFPLRYNIIFIHEYKTYLSTYQLWLLPAQVRNAVRSD